MREFHESLISVYRSSTDGELSKADLMQGFGYSNDPCRRSGSVVSKDIIENYGRKCVAEYQAPVLGFRLEFGRVIRGEIERDETWAVARFANNSGFKLQLSAGGSPINTGSWDFVASDGNEIISHVGNQCIKFR
ncbi:MAG: hypothetical protein AAF557_26350 [Pseudomonadota bacterium]